MPLCETKGVWFFSIVGGMFRCLCRGSFCVPAGLYFRYWGLAGIIPHGSLLLWWMERNSNFSASDTPLILSGLNNDVFTDASQGITEGCLARHINRSVGWIEGNIPRCEITLLKYLRSMWYVTYVFITISPNYVRSFRRVSQFKTLDHSSTYVCGNMKLIYDISSTCINNYYHDRYLQLASGCPL